MIDLNTVISDAHAVNSAITSASTLVIVAFGGSGSAGTGGGTIPLGGSGGRAQLATTLASYNSTYGTTKLYEFVDYHALYVQDDWKARPRLTVK